jgi:type II secretory pathway pseudopilin PulG
MTNLACQIPGRDLPANVTAPARHSPFALRGFSAFTLIEVMVAVALLSLIVIALMGVFNSTQTAFRASVTQTDALESGREAMGLITSDLRAMSPSFGYSNTITANPPVNFAVTVNNAFPPLVQPLVGSVSGIDRTNVVENVFILSRENQTWTGVGYVVDTAATNSINPLYRFSMSTNVAAANPRVLYNIFANYLSIGVFTNMSHLMDGVVEFRVRAYDPFGVCLTNGYNNVLPPVVVPVKNAQFFAPVLGETGFYMYSNALPAAVEIQMATLEDRVLQRAESRPDDVPGPPPNDARTIYLQQQAGKVHVFRQRVAIPNVDSSVYQ